MNLNIHKITSARSVSAAVVNISGRQRMLCQRSAFFCLRLVCAQNEKERAWVRQELLLIIDLMRKSHTMLVDGDINLNIVGEMSETIKEIYFQAPVNLNQKLWRYIQEVEALLQSQDDELDYENKHLHSILECSSESLLIALDTAVAQYQKESEEEQLAIDLHLLEIYQESVTAKQRAIEKANELSEALDQLKNTQAQLIQAEKMSSLGQLLAGVAHEINNPVSFISANLSYTKEYVNNLLKVVYFYQQENPSITTEIQLKFADIDLDFILKDLPKVISSMEVGAERICSIVRSLNNFSRNDQMKMSIVDIHEGIENTLLILQHRLNANDKHPGIQIIRQYDNIPDVECYSGQLNQVFMNIISNAIDALSESAIEKPDVTPTIIISTKFLNSKNITIEITDNGPGITEAVKQKIFDPFFTTKNVGKGTGLGLSISYQIIVERHKGILKCKSVPGEGTKFYIQIPWRHRASNLKEKSEVA